MDVLEYAKRFMDDVIKGGWPFQGRQATCYEVKLEADDSHLREVLDRAVKAVNAKPWVLTFDVESAEYIQAILDELDQSDPFPRVWIGANRGLHYAAEYGDEYDAEGELSSRIEVTHAHKPEERIPVEFKIVGTSVTSSDTPPYDPNAHKTLECIEEEAQGMVMGCSMAFINGACRWWTTDIRDCYMEHDAGKFYRPCCQHCGEPVTMVPLSAFLHNAREYAHTFGRLGLRALELAHASNLGRLMCLTDWDLYADAAEVHGVGYYAD